MVDIPNGLWPESNILVGGQPDDAAFRAAQDAGFKTIINLRGVGEPGTEQQPGLMNTLGFTYHHLPINGPQSINPNLVLTPLSPLSFTCVDAFWPGIEFKIGI